MTTHMVSMGTVSPSTPSTAFFSSAEEASDVAGRMSMANSAARARGPARLRDLIVASSS